MRTKSLFGLSHLRIQFEYGIDFYAARQEVINRLQFTQQLPPGVTPQISPETPTGEIYRYTLSSPTDQGRDLYTLNDLKALQDWTLERHFRRVPRIGDITSFGGTVKRYEVHPDPERMQQYGITLTQLQNAIGAANANTGGDYLRQGDTAANVRGIGLIGQGQDPMTKVLGMTDPKEAARVLREEEGQRLREIRQIVVASINNVPVRVDELVEGGPVGDGDPTGKPGVIVGHQTRLGQVAISRPKRVKVEEPLPWYSLEGLRRRFNAAGRTEERYAEVVDKHGDRVWIQEPEKVQGIVLLRKGEQSLPALKDVEVKVQELNQPGHMLPGVKIEPYYDRTELIHITTETVQENLLMGMALITVILLMFLSNVRSALIVAINVPLALLFAFSVLWARGKSANLLSIGAVDFGIIVDSSVIMVENIYRHISAGEYRELPLRERILRASGEVERGLFYSTAIMVCAFIPLFTMQGPEGQIFGPMADTYAFALGGALMLALTLSPVLCLLFFRRLKPARDNFLVRWLKGSYLRNVEWCLNHRALTLGVFGVLIVGTLAWLFLVPVLQKLDESDDRAAVPAWKHGVSALARRLPALGHEFMPELEEGNLWIRGTFPVNVALDEVSARVTGVRSHAGTDRATDVVPEKAVRVRDYALAIISKYPEVETVVAQLGRPDDGTDPTGFYNAEFFVPLKRPRDWPAVKPQEGLLGWFRGKRPRTKDELAQEMNAELDRNLIGIDWNFSQNIRDNVMESLSGVKGDNSIKIFGPDLAKLEELADQAKVRLQSIHGIENVGVFRIMGQSNLELQVDRKECARWGVAVGDVDNVIDVLRGKPPTQVIEGEKIFDLTVRWPERLRDSEFALLQIPVDITNNTVTQGGVGSIAQSMQGGPATGLSAFGTALPGPALTGSQFNATFNNLSNTPRRRLGDLVRPVDGSAGQHDFLRPGASTIYREQGQRMIAVKFSVRGRDLGSAVAEAAQKTAELFKPPYSVEWSGEFEEMQAAEARLMIIIPLSVGLVIILLYLAFRSILDVLVVLSNVVALSLGGIWALLLTNTHFSISAAVGFISIFGVAIMDGLLSVAYFNAQRGHGAPLREAILQGAGKRVRPMMMTALTAIFGLLPAALSTRIGAQTQRPLAIVVVGGMIMTLLLNRYLMPVLYSFYGHREPPAEAGGLAH
jgi:cobalt-zinc-cadmium resistance protein CzcA